MMSASAVKLDQALSTLQQTDGTPWTHAALSRRVLIEGLDVTASQLSQLRNGELPLPSRLATTLAFILDLPTEYFQDTTTPERAADLLHLTAIRARHPKPLTDVTHVELTALRRRLQDLRGRDMNSPG